MTIVGHAVSGWIGFRLFRRKGAPPPPISWTLAALVIPCLPDLDVLGMGFIPYGHILGHRGLSHSLLTGLAFGGALVLVGLRLGRVERTPRAMALAFLFGSLLWGSHGLLDAMTTGGKGIALWAPVSNERVWLPARVIPVSLLPGDLDATPERARAIRDHVLSRTGFPTEIPRALVAAQPVEAVFGTYLAGVVLTELLLLAPLAGLAWLLGGRAPPAMRGLAALVVAGAMAHGIGTLENRSFTEQRGQLEDAHRTPFRRFEPDLPRTRGVAVLLHGWRCSAAMMTPLAEALARNGVTVIAPEMPGHGRSPLPLELRYDHASGGPAPWREVRSEGVVAVLGILEALAREEGLRDRPVALIGHSWGGFMVDELEPPGIDVVARINLEGGSERLDEGRNQLFLGRESWLRIHVPSHRPATLNEVHGSFANGSASELRVLPPGGHLDLIRSEKANREMLRWLSAGFDDPLGKDPRNLSGLPFATALAMGVLVVAAIRRRSARVSPSVAPGPGVAWVWVTLAAAVAGRLIVPRLADMDPTIWRLAHEQLLLPVFFVAVGLPSAWMGFRVAESASGWREVAKAVGWGVAAFGGLYLGAGLYLDDSMQHIAIPVGRLGRFVLFTAAALPLVSALAWVTPPFDSAWARSGVRLLGWAVVLTIWGLGQARGVQAEALQVAALPLLCEGVGLALRGRSSSPWAPATFAALLWGWLWTVSYPVLG